MSCGAVIAVCLGASVGAAVGFSVRTGVAVGALVGLSVNAAAMVAVGRASGASAVSPSGKIPCCPKMNSNNAIRMAKMPDVARFGGCFC